MPFEFEHMEIPEVVLIKPTVFGDDRGFFIETYRRSEFVAEGIDARFVQDNHSRSAMGVIRGLHYQKRPKAQGKLVRVVVGEIFDVAIDLRRGSPTFGTWVGVTLSAQNKHMVYAPPWCAHGFCTLSEEAEVVYKATEEYSPAHEAGIIWNDPGLAIPWPISTGVLSPRDREWPTLANSETGFAYEPAATSAFWRRN